MPKPQPRLHFENPQQLCSLLRRVEVNVKSEVYVTKDFGISRSYQEVSIAIGEGSDENIVEMDTAMMDQSSADGGEGL